MKLFTASLAATLFTTVSFAQIPITTVGPAPGTPQTAPQPQLVPCVPANNSLLGTSWAFNDIGGNIAQIGTFAVSASTGRGGLAVTGNVTTNSLGTLLGRLAPFTGVIDTLCLAGTNVAAAGTLQISDGIGGQIFTWSFPITATIGADRSVTYAVTSVTTMNLRRYGALDPAGSAPNNGNSTDGYSYASGTYATSGVANLIQNQLACPVPANASLGPAFSPFGFAVSFGGGSSVGTVLNFDGVGPIGTVVGNLFLNTPNNPQPTETGSYQVYPGCTGFVMNIPYLRGGRIVGANFEGVFAAGDFSRAFILPQNTDGASFTLTRGTGPLPVQPPLPTRP